MGREEGLTGADLIKFQNEALEAAFGGGALKPFQAKRPDDIRTSVAVSTRRLLEQTVFPQPAKPTSATETNNVIDAPRFTTTQDPLEKAAALVARVTRPSAQIAEIPDDITEELMREIALCMAPRSTGLTETMNNVSL